MDFISQCYDGYKKIYAKHQVSNSIVQTIKKIIIKNISHNLLDTHVRECVCFEIHVNKFIEFLAHMDTFDGISKVNSRKQNKWQHCNYSESSR